MKRTPENIIKRQIKDYLNAKGWFNFPIFQSLGSYPGISDIIAIKSGRVLFIEVKSAKGVLSPAQKRFKCNIEASGGTYIVARSYKDIEMVIQNHPAKNQTSNTVKLNVLLNAVRTKIKEFESDEILTYSSATVLENAPRALIQNSLESKIQILNWVLEIAEVFNIIQRKTGGDL